MIVHIGNRLLRHKWIVAVVGLPILIALWWAFRPEKLWINEKVSEPAPFETSADPQPILTGRFDGNVSGRATVYRKPGGSEYLRLSDFTVPNNGEEHVELARSNAAEPDPDSIDLGRLTSNEADQNYDLPVSRGPNKYDAVLIYETRSHAVLSRARLEPF